MENKREQWGSNFGFLMAAIGSAVGLGNIWGFPYKMGMNGGFAFLIVYLVLVVTVGIVGLIGELAIGRKTGRGPVGAYKALSKKFAWFGIVGVLAGYLILAFYSVLGGMVMRYMVAFFLQMLGLDGFAGQGLKFFGYILYDYAGMLFFFALFIFLTLLIVMGGIKQGIEKFSAVAMPALLCILLFVIIYVALQPGASAGYAFMFKPDFSVFSDPEIGFFGVLKTAAGQMFFSLSLGMGCIMTYGSYLSKKENLQKNALIIPFADTMIAIMAGMAVMPACAAFGVEYTKGPGLLFVSMHTVFHNMGSFGNVIGFLFYFLVFIAAITSSISMLEVCTTFQLDRAEAKGTTANRKKASFINVIICFILGLPVALDALGSGGAVVKAPYELLGLTTQSPAFAMWNDCWLDFYDLMAEGILMPLGALVMCLLIGWAWKIDLIKNECEESGVAFKAKALINLCFKFIAPIIMIVVLYAQMVDFFK